MKIKDISLKTICNHIREIPENLTSEDIELLTAIKTAAVSYCSHYTGLSESNLNNYEDITIACLVLISDMWDNRSVSVERSTGSNAVIENILSMHTENLL